MSTTNTDRTTAELARNAARRRVSQLADIMVAEARNLANDLAGLDLTQLPDNSTPDLAVQAGRIAVTIGNYQALAANRLAALIEAAAQVDRT